MVVVISFGLVKTLKSITVDLTILITTLKCVIMALMTLRRAAGPSGCQVEDDPINIWPPQTKIFSQPFKSEQDSKHQTFRNIFDKRADFLIPFFSSSFLNHVILAEVTKVCKQFIHGDHIYVMVHLHNWLLCIITGFYT